MLHFFPRNYLSRRAIIPCDRRSSLGIHSLAISKERSKEMHKLNKSETISANTIQLNNNQKVAKYLAQQNSPKLWNKRQKKDENQLKVLKQRKKTLYIKGFCKNPSLQFQINEYKQVDLRQAITSNGRRLRKMANEKVRLGTSIPLGEKSKINKQFVLTKRKSRDNNPPFKGWEINQQDFTDF